MAQQKTLRRFGLACVAAAAFGGAWWSLGGVSAQGPAAAPSPFARTTIDLGTCVSDLEKSLAFYKDAIGFQEVGGFDVPAAMAQDSGLCDAGKPFKVHVLKLGTDETATGLKLFQFAGAAPAKPEQAFVHSSSGFRYLTIIVKDIDASVERAAKYGAKPIAKGPVLVPESIAKGIWLAVYKDPDGNFVELVGPKVSK